MTFSRDAYWRIAHADRAACLIDADAYYRALRHALLAAQKRVVMLGWDFNSRVDMAPTGVDDGYPREFVPFLNALVRDRPELEIYILDWDFALFYALEREPLPVFRFEWRTDKRIHFAMDSELPAGVSHHQKIVTIDDQLAFTGGLDVTQERWDTPEHLESNPYRVARDGREYGPFHDVQLILAGEAARDLAQIGRERWRRATGEALKPLAVRNYTWPNQIPVQFENVDVAISRTYSRYKEYPAVREIEQMHLEAFARARRFIFIENEYFTSFEAADAIADRLQEANGPEVVIVVPKVQSGRLEQSTMGVLRARVLRRVREADHFGRLRMLCPMIGNTPVNLHSKVLVVDDAIFKIGSANLSNRSFGTDSECDVTILASNAAESAQIAQCRQSLLAEHLGVSWDEVAQAENATGSIVAALDSFPSGRRRLDPLELTVPRLLEEWLPRHSMIDPELPMNYSDFMLSMAVEARPLTKRNHRRRLQIIVALLAALIFTGILWGYEGPALPYIRAWFSSYVPAGPWLVGALMLIGSALIMPMLPAMALTAVLLPPWQAILISFLSVFSGSLLGYATGRNLRRERVRRMAGDWSNRVYPWVERDGVRALIALRLFVGVPYGIVNLLSGAARIPLRHYATSSAIAVAVTATAITILAELIGWTLSNPQPVRVILLGSVVALYALVNRIASATLATGGMLSQRQS